MTRKWTRLRAGNCKENNFGLQQGFSTITAVAAWGLPAAHTIAVLVTRDVDADELTGKFYRMRRISQIVRNYREIFRSISVNFARAYKLNYKIYI